MEIRRDFPALHNRHPDNRRPPIYLDNSCVSLKPRTVAHAEWDYTMRHSGCGGHRSGHWFADETEQGVHEARQATARMCSVPAARGSDGVWTYPIAFTRNATEALNLVAHGLALLQDDTVLITDKEHNSNVCPWQEFERRGGRVCFVRCEHDNVFRVEQFERALRDDRSICVVSVHHASNLDGVSLPLAELIAAVRRIEREHNRVIYICVDGAQSAPHQRLNLGDPTRAGYLDVDFFVASYHKIMGPSGVGFLYGKPELLDSLRPFLVGGSTIFETSAFHPPIYAEWPARFEAGLQNYGGIHAAAAAVTYLDSILDEIASYEVALNEALTSLLQPLHDANRIRILGPLAAEQRGGVLTFLVCDADEGFAARLLALSQEQNMMYRSGTFCVDVWFSTHQAELSDAQMPIRLSSYVYNTLEEVELAAAVVTQALDGPR